MSRCDEMNDLISRQDTIDAIEKTYGSFAYMDEGFNRQDAIDIIKNRPSAQQWILCSERLPEEKDMVLVTRRSGDVDYVSWSDWWYKQDIYPYIKPIAWMPLPQPWKGE